MRRDVLSASRTTRKRGRDPDDMEFLPISKKLNNLHLEEPLPCAPYQPSLLQHQNPVYYEMNRVLYEAHLMRTSRARSS